MHEIRNFKVQGFFCQLAAYKFGENEKYDKRLSLPPLNVATSVLSRAQIKMTSWREVTSRRANEDAMFWRF